MSEQEYDKEEAKERMAKELTGYSTPAELLGYMPEDNTIPKSRYRKPLMPLKGCFEDYTSELTDVSSPCERLDPQYQAFLDSKQPIFSQKGGIDVNAFREWSEALDRDKEWIEKTEKELF